MLKLELGFLLLMLARQQRGVLAAAGAEDKTLKICSITGGLDIARLFSSNTRNFFRSAIEDVELIREYISESAVNGGISGFHDLSAMAATLDREARGLNPFVASNTVNAGLGYTDDRADRRVERYVSLNNEPIVGDKAADIAMIDSASNIFPWIVDRKSIEERWWLKDHQNGRSEGPTKEKFRFEQLYVAAWIGTYGEAWLYYPPMRVYGHPFSFGDILGPNYNSHEEEFVKPNLPENKPDRSAYFTAPYPDSAIPGLSLITAQAPIYFTGQWHNYTYNDTYVASTGVDLSVEAVSTLLEELEGSLTANSFAFLVDATTFHMIVISQTTVEKVYPSRTGFEDSRVTYDHTNGEIISDRRNETYQVSDTIFQAPTQLNNANWTALQERVSALKPGERAYTNLNITLTGDQSAREFHVMYERWPSVADWTLVLFAPESEVTNAVNVAFDDNSCDLVAMKGSVVEFEKTIFNHGTLSIRCSLNLVPDWIKLQKNNNHQNNQHFVLAAGENLTLHFMADTQNLEWGTTQNLISVSVEDEDYPDCFYNQDLTAAVTIRVQATEELNQINRIRPYGFTLASLICASSAAWSLWTFLNTKHFVVRSSQPIFLHMMCLGTFIMGTSLIPLGIDDSIASVRGCDIACMTFPWLLACGFSITFSALFSKIWRVNQIFRASRNCQRVQVTVRHVIIPFLVIFSLNLICLTIWTALDPLKWERTAVHDSNGSGDHRSYGHCSLHGSTLSTICFCLILAVNFAALVLALIQIYRSRNVAERFRQETRYITVAMASMIQVFLTGLPILVIVTNNPPVSFFVKSSIIFVVCMSLVCLTFIPKFCTANTEPERAPASSIVSFGGSADFSDDQASWSKAGGSVSFNSRAKLPVTGRRKTFAEGSSRIQESARRIKFELDRKDEGSDHSDLSSCDAIELAASNDGNVNECSAFEKSCSTAVMSNRTGGAKPMSWGEDT